MAAVAAILLVPTALATAAAAAPAATLAPLLVTTTSPLTATAGSAYVAKLDATGGAKPYSWSLAGGTSLPAGLVLHAANGEITGTPAGPAGASDFIAEVTDSEGSPVSAIAYESITVIVTPLTVTTVSLPAATAGVAYSATLASAGGVAPYSWSIPVGSLPAGLKLHAATGVISGTPTAGGNFTFTAEVTDSEAAAQTNSASEAITVGVSGLVVTTGSTLPTATSGVPYSVKLGAAGGVTPYEWSLASGSLPAGLKLKSTGVLSGTTTATGPDSFAVQVTDSEAPAESATENVSLYVVTPMVVEGYTLLAATTGEPYDSWLSTSGGLGPYSYAITAGSLPPGLALLPDGDVTGVPSGPGGFNFTVSVTDAENPPATVTQADWIPVLVGITKASPALSTTPNQVNGPVGSVLQDTATLTGSSSATGSIEFRLYPTADCSGPPVDDETVPVTGDGSYATTTGYAAAAAGTYQWTASYSGDAGNNPAASGCGAEQVEISSSPDLYWADGLGNIVTASVIGGVPSAPHVVLNDQNGPAWVAASGGTVYWADRGTGAIMSVPATGGTPTVLASGQNDPAYLTVDNGTVYWADSSEGTVMAVPVTGGTPTVLASGQPGPAYVTVDNGSVYWADSSIGTIMEVPVTGGITPSPLVSGLGNPAYVTANGGIVYWADGGQVMADRETAGSTPFALTEGEADPAYLTANGGAVYWTDPVSGAIWKVTMTDGIPSSPGELAVDAPNGPAYLVAGSVYLSWIDSNTDTIMEVPVTGGTPAEVAGGSYDTAYLAAGQ
jgi:sugar lactone lactonase YvrE